MSQSTLLSDPKKLLQALVLCLNQLLSQSKSIQGQSSIFDLKNKPTISFGNYLMRIFNFMGCSLSAYIYALILIDKIQQQNQGFRITEKNIHRLLFTSIVVATKFIDDKYYKNKFYASVGGLSLTVLNELQQKMLELINYHCPVNSQIFNSYEQKLQVFVQQKMQTQKPLCSRPVLLQIPKSQNQQLFKHRRKLLRQKRQRSREKTNDKSYDTQESRDIQQVDE